MRLLRRVPAPEHGDAGLQPERTSLAWGRTSMAMVVAAAIFFRWMPHHGWFAGTLVGLTLLSAWGINLTQKRRYHRAVRAIAGNRLHADVLAVLFTSGTVVLLGGLGIYTVIFLPLD